MSRRGQIEMTDAEVRAFLESSKTIIITSIGPGEAVIFIETADLPTAAAAFRSLWFGANAPRTPQIGSYSGSGVGLSSNGDEVAHVRHHGTCCDRPVHAANVVLSLRSCRF